MRGNIMKKTDKSELKNELRAEYDLTKLKDKVRGKYAQRYKEASMAQMTDVHEVNKDSGTTDTDTK
jgi:hypothetical protein